MSAAAAGTRFQANDRRELFGWIMYDWAHSAFVTSVGTVLMGPYVTSIAQAAVGENGVIFSLGQQLAIGPAYALGPVTFVGPALTIGPVDVTAKSLFADTVSLSVFFQVFFLPFLGSLADYTNLKRRLLTVLTVLGATATSLLVLVGPGMYLLGAGLYLLANLSFGAAVVLYNAYLNEIATPDQRDKVSSRGFAFGYLGGGLLLAANLALVQLGPGMGIPTAMAVRISLLSAGLWWGGFGLFALSRLRERGPQRVPPPGRSILGAAVTELRDTFRDLRRLPQTLRFLLGYLLYNDGIQTVIALASVFLAQELFVARGLEPSQTFLISIILMVQFIAFFGALGFERLAQAIGAKNAILLSLVLWSGVIVYAYAFLQTTNEALVMGAVIAVVLGGSQALSRSLFSRLIPAGKEASFFGLYEISERGTSWIGPFIFARVVAATGSYRQAILSVILLLLSGMVLLALTDTARAQREAEHLDQEGGDDASSVPAGAVP